MHVPLMKPRRYVQKLWKILVTVDLCIVLGAKLLQLLYKKSRVVLWVFTNEPVCGEHGRWIQVAPPHLQRPDTLESEALEPIRL